MKEELSLAKLNGKDEKKIKEINDKYISLLKDFDYKQREYTHKKIISEGRKIKEYLGISSVGSGLESCSSGYLGDKSYSSDDEEVRKIASIYDSNSIPNAFFGENPNDVLEIKIIGMNIEEISSNISMFKKATILKISDCPLLKTFPDISQMHSLRYLIINRCPSLKLLKIKDHYLSDLNVTKCGLIDLKLDNVRLTNLVIKECLALKKINAKQLSYLVNVNLSFNQITDISPFMEFRQIEKLVCKNRYQRILYPIRNIINENNKFQTKSLIVFIGEHPLKTGIKEKELVKRTVINGIESLRIIPDNIYQLSNLTDLDLSGNLINSIPEKLSLCKNLKYLNLKNNNIEVLNVGICLKNASKIILYGNKIKFINDYFKNLKKLEELELGYNNIKVTSFYHDLFHENTEVKADDFHIPFNLAWKKKTKRKEIKNSLLNFYSD